MHTCIHAFMQACTADGTEHAVDGAHVEVLDLRQERVVPGQPVGVGAHLLGEHRLLPVVLLGEGPGVRPRLARVVLHAVEGVTDDRVGRARGEVKLEAEALEDGDGRADGLLFDEVHAALVVQVPVRVLGGMHRAALELEGPLLADGAQGAVEVAGRHAGGADGRVVDAALLGALGLGLGCGLGALGRGGWRH